MNIALKVDYASGNLGRGRLVTDDWDHPECLIVLTRSQVTLLLLV